jgi:hypothetical protein
VRCVDGGDRSSSELACAIEWFFFQIRKLRVRAMVCMNFGEDSGSQED